MRLVLGPVRVKEGDLRFGRSGWWSLREVRRRRGALEKIRAKKVGENLPSFFFIFRRWQVALSAICQLLNIKKIPSIIFQRASFQRGGYL